MKHWMRMAAIVTASMLVVAEASAQQATPAQPSAATEAPAAPAAGPNVARVSETNGRAMLNRASVYEVAKKDQRLQANDRLVVLEQGVVKVQYDNGCTVTIDSPQVYSVAAVPPCAPGTEARGVRAATPASGTGAVAGASTNDYLKWGLVALGIATPLLLLSDSTQGSPISP